MWARDSEEFQYLNDIKDLSNITKEIDKIVSDWHFVEHYNMQCNNVKDKLNVKELKEKLLRLKNEIEEL